MSTSLSKGGTKAIFSPSFLCSLAVAVWPVWKIYSLAILFVLFMGFISAISLFG